jgi:hypothetical protein
MDATNPVADATMAHPASAMLLQSQANAQLPEIQPHPMLSPAQLGCIQSYRGSLEQILPGSGRHLHLREWGGSGMPLMPGKLAPVLGAALGTTAGRSLAVFAKQIGLRTHHDLSEDKPKKSWAALLNAVRGKHANGSNLNTHNECADALNAFDFGTLLSDGFDVLLDTLVADQFLDFYALSPNSKVILSTQSAKKWIEARLKHHPLDQHLPVQSRCGAKLQDVDAGVAARMFEAHQELVRCMVPKDKLLELDVLSGTSVDTGRIAQFLGKSPNWEIPFPKLHRSRRATSLAVCITGQIGRLELRSKVQNLIEPSVKAGMEVQVALVLDPRRKASYVHSLAGGGVDDSYIVTDGPFEHLQSAANSLPSDVSVIADAFIPAASKVNTRYLQELIDSSGNRNIFTKMYSRTRFQSHAQQWQAMSRCWDLLAEAGSTKMNYMLRVREDIYFHTPFVPSGASPGLKVPSCSSYDGLNDQLALAVGPDVARLYLTSPLEKMVSHFDDVLALQRAWTNKSLNPETVLYNVAIMNNISITRMRPEEVSFSPARSMMHGDRTFFWATHHYMRDCIGNASSFDNLVQKGVLRHLNPKEADLGTGRSFSSQLYIITNTEGPPIASDVMVSSSMMSSSPQSSNGETKAPTSEQTESPTSPSTETTQPDVMVSSSMMSSPQSSNGETEAPTSEPTESPTSGETEAPTSEPTESPSSPSTETTQLDVMVSSSMMGSRKW